MMTLQSNKNNWQKTFAFIWVGQLFSTLTSSVVSFAIIFWLSVQTGSAEVLAYSTLASMMPHLVLGFFTGVLIDRWNRKRVMIIADLYVAALTAVMAVLFYTGNVHLGFIYTLLALRSIGSAFHSPAMEASVPLLAPEDKLIRVAGVNNMIFSVSTIAAPAIAALFISVFDMTWVLMLDVIGALIACTSLLFVNIPNPVKVSVSVNLSDSEKNEALSNERFSDSIISKEPDISDYNNGYSTFTVDNRNSLKSEFRKFFMEFRQGIHEIKKRRGIMWMFIFTVFASLAMVPVSTLFPLMTLDHFAGDTYKMSFIEITWGIGMLLGGVLMTLPKFKFDNVKLINSSYIVLGASFLLSGFLPPEGFYLFSGFSLIGGIAGAIFWGAFTVLLQTSIDPGVLGRVFSIHGSLIMIPAMFSLVATGYIADTIGITNTFIIGGASLILIGVISFYVAHIFLSHRITSD
ncbi:MAG: MFS transporter [Rikenellaceae bacterium]|nr:MFS transporter [Rikenellaceae bacterium]